MSQVFNYDPKIPTKEPKDPLRVVTVVSGILQKENSEILLVQRPKDKPMPGLWEFPGGKLEPFETPEKALIREIFEEINLIPTQFRAMPFVSHAYENFHVVLLPYLITKWEGDFLLKEHQTGYMWVLPEDMHQFPRPKANRIVEEFFYEA